MNPRISALQVAQRFVDTICLGFENEPVRFLRLILTRVRHAQPKLERHIESWHARLPGIQLHPG